GMLEMGMSRTDMAMMLMPAFKPWGHHEVLVSSEMWLMALIAIMTPAAMPVLGMYARERKETPRASGGWMTGGFLATWFAFALIGAGAQWEFERLTLLAPWLAVANNLVGGVVLIAAGLYQWMPLQDMYLAKCDVPGHLVARFGGFGATSSRIFGLGL